MSHDDLKYERIAALHCGAEGDENCRHAWNAAHPEDQITEEDQRRAMMPIGPPRQRKKREREARIRIWHYRRWCWICWLCPYPTVGFNIPRWQEACEEAEIHFNLYHRGNCR